MTESNEPDTQRTREHGTPKRKRGRPKGVKGPSKYTDMPPEFSMHESKMFRQRKRRQAAAAAKAQGVEA
jgi:hypothetical protein